jgi:protein YIPF5/7
MACVQTGKLHFGVILGWSVVHSVLIWFLLNQLSGTEAEDSKGLDLYSCCCVVGYCLLPICVYSALGLVVPR